MDDNIKQRLEVESAIGDQHKAVWENLIEPFFDAKQKELYDLFLATESKNINGLQTIRLQSNVLAGMKQHFMTYIDTGEMAKLTIETEGKKDGSN